MIFYTDEAGLWLLENGHTFYATNKETIQKDILIDREVEVLKESKENNVNYYKLIEKEDK